MNHNVIENITMPLYKTDKIKSKTKPKYRTYPAKIIFSNRNVKNVKSLNWLFSKRSHIKISHSELIVGKQTYYLSDILKTTCFKLKSNLLFGYKYSVIRIKLSDNNFIYIGLNSYYNKINNLLEIDEYVENDSKVNYFVLVMIISAILLFVINIFLF